MGNVTSKQNSADSKEVKSKLNKETTKSEGNTSTKKKKIKDSARHVAVYSVLQIVARIYTKVKFGFKHGKPIEVPQGCLIVSNHTTNYDFLMVGSSFKKHMYFVGSEHIMRKGFVSKMIEYFFGIITRKKATVAAATVMEIKRRLNAGHNVCLFAEGQISMSGCSNRIVSSTAAVIQRLNVPVATFRMYGGYLSSPRWAMKLRKGKMSGELVRIYTPEEIKAMSVEELDRCLNEDLYVNAYEYNDDRRIAYKCGKHLAEGIEFGLVLCPQCGRLASLHGEGDSFACECGMTGSIDEYGYLHGEDRVFDTVLAWDEWQRKQIEEMKFESKEVILSHDDQVLRLVEKDRKMRIVATGKLQLTKECLSVGNYRIEVSDISSFDMIMRGFLLVNTTDKRYYEISNKKHLYPGYAYKLVLANLIGGRDDDRGR